MTLPQNNELPISRLAGIFSNTTATYKFYWFVALLDIVVKERKNTNLVLGNYCGNGGLIVVSNTLF